MGSVTFSERVIRFALCISIFYLGKCCVLHSGDGSSEGSITLFNEKTLEKFKYVLSVRKSKNIKYSDVIIHDTTDKSTGFHIECYRKFTALGKK